MSRQEGDPCPHCKKGRLSVDSDREVREYKDGSTASHVTWVCDKCKRKTRDFYRGIVEAPIEVSDSVSASKEVRRTVQEDGIRVDDTVGPASDTVANSSSTLAVMGVLRDGIDDLCKAIELVFAIIEKYDRDMKLLVDDDSDDNELSHDDAVRDILDALPPEKASAAIIALLDFIEFSKSFSVKNPDKQLGKMEKGIDRLHKIRDNLHKALDGEVP